jgi:regulator of protease activity HflC (stomatin/prohibitin superfamily)
MVLFALLSVLLLVVGLFVLIFKGNKTPIRLAGFVMTGVGLFFLFMLTIVTVPAGHVGVVYDPFAGGVQEYQLAEGFHVIAPWQEITQYSLRTMTYNMHEGGDDIPIYALTSEGLEVLVDVSIVYHIKPDKAWEIHKTIGENYAEVLIKPIARATVRDLIAFYKAEDLYTTEKRVILQTAITKKIQEQLEPRGIVVEAVLVRDINLPKGIKEAIEAKLQAEQDAKRMEFVLQKEQKEAERKVIEAKGIAESNKIIADSLTQNYLTWYWIQSLKDQNSVIYVPIGENGLPIFKNVDETKPQ